MRFVVDDCDVSLVSEYTWYLCNGYARADVWKDGKRSRVYMHRLISGAGSGQHVDHANGEKLDNRRSNLRLVSRSQNMQNRRGATVQSSSGLRGVFIDRRDGGIYARVTLNGKAVNLGRFATLDEAGAAVAKARAKLMTHSSECANVSGS